MPSWMKCNEAQSPFSNSIWIWFYFFTWLLCSLYHNLRFLPLISLVLSYRVNYRFSAPSPPRCVLLHWWCPNVHPSWINSQQGWWIRLFTSIRLFLLRWIICRSITTTIVYNPMWRGNKCKESPCVLSRRENQKSNTAYYNYHMNECLNGRYSIKSSIGKVSI